MIRSRFFEHTSVGFKHIVDYRCQREEWVFLRSWQWLWQQIYPSQTVQMFSLLKAEDLFFFFFSSIWPNIICLALRCLEAGRQTERTTAQAGDSIRIQSSICNCSSWKVDVRGVRQRRLKSFASPVVHTDKVTFIQSSLWTPLLGRWLMMEWQGRWRTHRPGRLCIRMCGQVKSRAPSEECRSGNARWLCDHKPDWPWRFPARVKG